MLSILSNKWNGSFPADLKETRIKLHLSTDGDTEEQRMTWAWAEGGKEVDSEKQQAHPHSPKAKKPNQKKPQGSQKMMGKLHRLESIFKLNWALILGVMVHLARPWRPVVGSNTSLDVEDA